MHTCIPQSMDRRSKNILITGAAGFIGTNLCLRFRADPAVRVFAVDNLLTSPPMDPAVFGSPPGADNRFQFIQCDVIHQTHLLADLPPIDEIYHLASLASPPKYKKYPIETLDVNVIGTRNMLELAAKHRAKFILTSTSEVYGDPLEHPQRESYFGNVNVVGERSCYDESKRCAETYVFEFRRKYGGDFKICRIFNTYGPHMDLGDGRVITNIISNIVRNRPITIYGDGEQTRSFCYIDDLLDGLTALMASTELGPVNLGNPHTECTMNRLIEIFESELCAKLYTLHEARTENDPMVRRPDISLASRALGFSPRVGLQEGIHRTFLHFTSTDTVNFRKT